MQTERLKTFLIDGDELTISYHYDEDARIFIGQFPEFEAEPRYTPNGRPWKSVISDGCPYAAGGYNDCGSCPYLIKDGPDDIIGVCFHESLRSRVSPRRKHSRQRNNRINRQLMEEDIT